MTQEERELILQRLVYNIKTKEDFNEENIEALAKELRWNSDKAILKALNQLLTKAKAFNDFDITSTLYYYIFTFVKKQRHTFASTKQREAISEWLNKAGILSAPFSKLWYVERIPFANETINNQKAIPKNPFPKIFTSYNGYRIFEAFKDEIVTKRTEYADYSFLFSKLKQDEFIHDLKEKKLIDFLSKEYNIGFATKYNQFKYSETTAKKKAYSNYKKLFQHD